MILTDGMISLRAPEPDDVEAMYRWENDPRVWDTGDSAVPMSRHALTRYIDSYDGDIASSGQLRLIIADNASGEAVGTLDLFEYSSINRRCGVGILVDERCRRRGIGIRALDLVSDYCGRRLGLNTLWCTVAVSNRPSRALFSAAGFKEAGILTSWTRTTEGFTDVVIYQKRL